MSHIFNFHTGVASVKKLLCGLMADCEPYSPAVDRLCVPNSIFIARYGLV